MKIIIIEDNVETLGVLRDFVRTIDPAFSVQTMTHGNVLLESKERIDTDLIILGYDLGHAVTGTELLHYLEWSGRISAKTQVVFISNTIELAKRQAPLRFTQTRFLSKPISSAHIEDIINRAQLNQQIFSGVFYLIDKQKWQAAFNSLQLCKQGCPAELQEQAWLLECKLLIALRRYAKVLRRYQLVQDYEWSALMRLRSLVGLGQVKLSRQVFNSLIEQAPYYSSGLALINQLLSTTDDEFSGILPATIKDAELSLFECEFRAIALVIQNQWIRAMDFIQIKQKRTQPRSHQQYFFAMARVKACVFRLLLSSDDATECAQTESYLSAALEQLKRYPVSRDEQLVEELTLLQDAVKASAIRFEQATRLQVGKPAESSSPFALMIFMLNRWRETGLVSVVQVEQCVELIEKQGATSRASSNLILFEHLLRFMVPDARQTVKLNDAVGKRLLKAGAPDLAAFAFNRALEVAPEDDTLIQHVRHCMAKLEVKHFLHVDSELANG